MNTDPGHKSPAADFDVEFYKLHRAHEVALNSATSAYEQSLLRLVLIFNAASIGGFLALIQAKDSLLNYSYCRATLAICVWLAGIAAAFLATWIGYISQRNFTRAFRARRKAVEMFKAPPDDPIHIARSELYGWTVKRTDEVVAKTCEDANTLRDQADRAQKWVVRFGFVAVALSIVGFILALLSIYQGARQQAGAGDTISLITCIRNAVPPTWLP